MGRFGTNGIKIKGTVVKTVDLEDILVPEGLGDTIRLRIEVLENLNGSSSSKFTVRIWRLENYRIQPTFPVGENIKGEDSYSDEVILVEDNLTLAFEDRLQGSSIDKVLNETIKVISEQFSAEKK